MSVPKVVEAIVLTSRNDLRNAVREELRRVGITNEYQSCFVEAEDCVDKLGKSRTALLVLDWDTGPDKVLEVMEANRERGKLDAHAVFLIASSMDQHIVSAAAEYHVSQIHSGEISPLQIRQGISQTYRAVTHASPIKKLLKSAGELRVNEEYDKIHKLLEPMYQKMPDNPRIAVEYAENLMKMGSLGEAEEVLSKAVDLDPPYARAQHMRAKLLIIKGSKEEATESLKDAQLINPYNVDRLVEMGNLFLEMNRPEDAKESFDAILDFAPQSKKGTLGKTTAMLAEGDVNQALVLLKDSANSAEIASVFNTTAILACRNDKFEEAISLYDTAISAIGKNRRAEAKLYFNKGIGFVKWGDFKQAQESFKKAVELDEGFEDARHNLKILTKVAGKSAGTGASKKKKKKKVQATPDELIPADESLAHNEVQEALDLGSLSETTGGASLSDELSSMSFDLNFDDDMSDL